jgi:hypothetical protein
MAITAKDPVTVSEIQFDTVVDDNATVVTLSLREAGWAIYATGSSKRHPGDPRNPGVARQLALGRALLDLGAAFVAAGNSTDHVTNL